MNRNVRRWRPRSLVACGLVAAFPGCHEEVSLGGWSDVPGTLSTTGLGGTSTTDTVATATTTVATSIGGTGGVASTGTVGVSGAAGEATEPPGLPDCLAAAVPGPSSLAGAGDVATETATDWTWPTAMTSLEWEIRVERETEPRVDGPDLDPFPDDGSGYYYSHQFSFQGGNPGFLGIQAEGGYSDPSATPPTEYVFTKIVTFWMSALDAELGDLPESRVWNDAAGGVEYLTIHGKFAWEVCRTYRLRLAPHSSEADGSTWYGAWITDVDAGIETFIGRMLMPPNAGLLAPLSTSRTQGFDFNTACDLQQTASVLYGTPSADDGALAPLQATNRFGQLRGCPGSRFSFFDNAVRHELNVHP